MIDNKKFFNFNLLKTSLIFLILSVLMYIVLLKYYIPITNEIVPWGDPFTYELGYYELLNKIRSDAPNNGVINLINHIFVTNWYWLQKLLIFSFSPLLINEPYSLCIINFFVYTIASILFYVMLIEFDVKKNLSRIIAILFWFYPINYSFKEYSALPMMGLDSTFLGALYCLIFSYLTFLRKPEYIPYQFLFSFSLCAALIGRGNSISVMTMLLFFPSIYFFYGIIKNKNYQVLKNFLIPAFFFICTLSWFFYCQLKPILNYYSVFRGFVTSDIMLMLPYLKHVPGIFFLYPEPSEINLMQKTDLRVLTISIICHIINFLSLILSIFLKSRKFKIIVFSGLFIFYATFFINLLLWMNPHISIYNAQLIWAPMRIGFVLTLGFMFIVFFNKFNPKLLNFIFILSVMILLTISNYTYKKQYEFLFANKSENSPQNIKKIDKLIKDNSKPNSAIILWFGPNLNPRILNYYSMKSGSELISYYRGKYADHIWNQSFTDEEFKTKVEYEINSIFDKVDLIVLNESSNNFLGSYAWVRYKEYITKQIKLGKLENFKLIEKVRSIKGNLLVLKRSKDNNKNFTYSTNGKDYIINY